MAHGSLAPVDGDPHVVAQAARSFESIAADVAAAASRLRTLANADASWTGTAARSASARAASLPPKLDKARASYAGAAGALRGYATALSGAQAESRAAIAAARAAQADLDAARAAYAAAQIRDAQAAAAATAAGQPPPSPAAPRLQSDIESAAVRLRLASEANDSAHEAQSRAAKTAAGGLRQASRDGIHNKPWWQHVLSDVGHWASTAWAKSLKVISVAATAISALAGLAALALAIAGIFFPPLEAAAATLEAISLVSAAVGAVADATLAATGQQSWTAFYYDTAALLPVAGSIATRTISRLRELRATQRAVRLVERERVAPQAEALVRAEVDFRIVGRGTGTRNIDYRPRALDPNWGLTSRHLEKHLFGTGRKSLSVIDPSGNADTWLKQIQDLAARAPSLTRSDGVVDIIGRFSKADGSGTFKLGIRLSAEKPDSTFDLITLLTRQ